MLTKTDYHEINRELCEKSGRARRWGLFQLKQERRLLLQNLAQVATQEYVNRFPGGITSKGLASHIKKRVPELYAQQSSGSMSFMELWFLSVVINILVRLIVNRFFYHQMTE